MRVPILTYHSHRILGASYELNDHIALERDLRVLQGEGFRVVPLQRVVDWVRGDVASFDHPKVVGLSFDDGADYDFLDLRHHEFGAQQGFFGILTAFRQEVGLAAQPSLSATAFVIASPAAHEQLDRRSMYGKGWMSDGWWKLANDSSVMTIGNHSWDHVHPALDSVRQKDQRRGDFAEIDTLEECVGQIEAAARFIETTLGSGWPALFAYPFGQASRYIRDVYFPLFESHHRTRAAFSTRGDYASRESSPWDIPRFVCGCRGIGWESEAELRQILNGAVD